MSDAPQTGSISFMWYGAVIVAEPAGTQMIQSCFQTEMGLDHWLFYRAVSMESASAASTTQR